MERKAPPDAVNQRAQRGGGERLRQKHCRARHSGRKARGGSQEWEDGGGRGFRKNLEREEEVKLKGWKGALPTEGITLQSGKKRDLSEPPSALEGKRRKGSTVEIATGRNGGGHENPGEGT